VSSTTHRVAAPALKRGLNAVLVVGGFGLFVLGTWVAWQSYVLANSTMTISRTL
jgi:hypothetical protein